MANRSHLTDSLTDSFWRSLGEAERAELRPMRRHLEAKGCTDGHVRNQLSYVAQFSGWLAASRPSMSVAEATQDAVEDYMIWLNRDARTPRGKPYAKPSVVSRRTALRSYYRLLSRKLNIREGNPVDEVPAPAMPDSHKDIVPLKALAELLASLDKAKRYRDAAIVSLLVDTGLRAGECAAIRTRAESPDDIVIDFDEQVVRIPGDAAKNKEERLVGYNPQTAFRLDTWMAKRPDRGTESTAWLFTGQPDKGVYTPYTVNGLGQRIKKIFAKAGMPGVGPHDLRHTWATHSLDHPDAKETSVMTQAGWNSHRMLRNYTRRSEQRRAVAQNLKTSPLAQIG